MNHKVTIKLNGQITNAGTFNTREELDAWVEKHQGRGTFGSPERWEAQEVVIQPLVLDEMGNILQEEIREVRNVLIASEWTYEYEDLTQVLQQEEQVRQHKNSLRKKLKSLNDDAWKNVNTIAEVKAILREVIDSME